MSVIAGLVVGIGFVAVFSIIFASPSSAMIKGDNEINLSIEGMKSTYKSGEQIIFNVNAKGISDNACNIGSPSVYMRDNSNGKTIYWPNPFGFSTSMLCNGPEPVNKEWMFGDDAESEIVLEKPGSYTLVTSLEDITIEKKFVVTQAQTRQEEAVEEPPVGVTTGPIYYEPRSYVIETGKSAVVVEVASENISLKRGSSVNIEVIARHIGGANADQSVNVKVLPPIGYTVYPPSAAKLSTPEERFEAAKTGTPIQGGIDLATFMTVEAPSEKAISKASQQVYSVIINVPIDLPDEFVGDAIFIPVNIEATDINGSSLPGQGAGLTVIVNE